MMRINIFSRLKKDERGSWMMVMTMGILPVILLFTSFGLDFGRVFLLKHELQGAVDAAALAGTINAEIHFVYDGGTITGVTPVINRALADVEAANIFNANVGLTNLTGQDVTIVSTTVGALNDTHYQAEVLADIKSYIAGPIMNMWGDSSFLFTRVRRTAIAEVRL